MTKPTPCVVDDASHVIANVTYFDHGANNWCGVINMVMTAAEHCISKLTIYILKAEVRQEYCRAHHLSWNYRTGSGT